ncbi:ferric reductase [Aliishimia ponticola]|uniref:Ferric reductase n=1 Tax=Aliishimia ponticola TaxID=2499833 RepID=A0A4S4NM92_9RHOB|nr:ferric reductase-like transmembrane domain-containing protein [Aliishimia ponticola]THH37350.1 ferric reductase [Aliishimia ponticola]
MSGRRATLIGALVGALTLGPLAIAATSPLLQWRQPVYIAAGFAGVAGLALLLLQPLLIRRLLPGIDGRRWHRVIGVALVLMVVIHIAGLWITSPPDVVDVLLFRSPTPFSIWGALAMWAIFGAAFFAALRRRLSPRVWRLSHLVAVTLAVLTTAAHAVLIDGTMGTLSKLALCAAALTATAYAVVKAKPGRMLKRR